MAIPDGIVESHARLSRAAARFVAHAVDRPEWRDPDSFGRLNELAAVYNYHIQRWPTFITEKTHAHLGEIGTGLVAIVKSLCRRVFKNDPVKIGAFFKHEPDLVRLALTEPTGIEDAPARVDCILTEDGFKVMEFNMGSYLGGWNVGPWGPFALEVPLFRELFGHLGITPRATPTIRAFWQHFLAATVRDLAPSDPVNIGMELPPVGHPMHDLYFDEPYRQAFAEAVATLGLPGGELVMLTADEKRFRDRCLYRGETRLHGLFEQDYITERSSEVLQAFKLGTLSLFTGPASILLDDKRNLALLSALQDAPLFDEDERALIRAHIPWTRMVKAAEISIEGERVSLPDYIVAHRDRLVMKPGQSFAGRDILIGRTMSETAWGDALREALERGDTIVQEMLDVPPYLYLDLERGPCPHHLVWGLIVLGSRFGGTYLRTMPRGGSYVVNAAQGATESMALIVDEQ